MKEKVAPISGLAGLSKARELHIRLSCGSPWRIPAFHGSWTHCQVPAGLRGSEAASTPSSVPLPGCPSLGKHLCEKTRDAKGSCTCPCVPWRHSGCVRMKPKPVTPKKPTVSWSPREPRWARGSARDSAAWSPEPPSRERRACLRMLGPPGPSQETNLHSSRTRQPP